MEPTARSASDPIAAAVAAARAELLDPGLANPLVRLRIPRSRGVEVVDERAVEVWRILVTEGRAMDFLPVEDHPVGDPLAQPQRAGAAGRHLDRHLQTADRSTALQRRLVNTAHAARTLVEEQGHNALALALGMLHWRHGDTDLRSPLVLMPALLERTNARCRYTVRHSEEDIGGNLSLAALLKAEHGFELPLPTVDEGFDLGAWFDDLDARLSGRPGWRLARDEIALSLFDSKRFLLYRDLDPDGWPAGRAPHQHRVVRAVLGGGFDDGDETPLAEQTIDMELPIEVVDADTSQSAALQLVAGGGDAVIQGPPGTGKSQTITNLVAQAVSRGERVLFVAEKMAALDVVHRRLERVGLGAACLELHSHKTRKKAVLGELRRTLDLGPPRIPADADAEMAALMAVTARLEGHHLAMVRPVDPSGISPVHAIGRLSMIAHAEALPRLPFGPMARWRRADRVIRRERVAELQARVADLGPPDAHPFAGCRRAELTPTGGEAVARQLRAAEDAIRAAMTAHRALATSLALDPPTAPHLADRLRAIGAALSDAPPLGGEDAADGRWSRERTTLEDALDAADGVNAIRGPWAGVLLDEAWPEDLLAATPALIEARGAIKALSGAWWRWFSGRWRSAKATVALLHVGELPEAHDRWIDALTAVIDGRRALDELAALSPIPASLFRTRWSARHPDAGGLRAVFEWLTEVHARVDRGEWPAAIRGRIGRGWDIEAVRAATRRATQAESARIAAVEALSAALGWGGPALVDAPFGEVLDHLRRWREHLGALPDLVRYNRLAAAARAEGLDDVVDLAERWPGAAERLVDAFDAAWYRGILETARAERPPLADFDRVRHLHAVERFCALDHGRFAHERARVAAAHHAGLPRGDAPGLALLRREMEKKTRHLPLRRLFVEAGPAVQRIKPVFLMSPMSVAAYLAPEGPRFDLVIFDEASQVRPVDALGALARAERAVVVGDSKQMPPTRFFERLLDSGDLIDGDDNVTADLESVLGLFAAAGAPPCLLRWHYRSRHPSLIAVSNHLFYGDGLTLFPSPVREPAADDDLGLSWRHLPDAIYERGESRTNPVEAEAVAEMVLEHAIRTPERTLGVVAFSTAQMEAIQQAIERRRRTALDGEAFFAAHVHEPFFVKNLENVQGDERDVILISVGYGRTADGKVYPQFGPLNADGGERRLNVLITRARRRCVVFTNLEPEEIDLSRTASRGVAALRTFLAYARDGHLATAPPLGDSEAPFEEALHRALEARGHTVHRRIGEGAAGDGCAVPLAIVDPDQPGRYLLGIDCDGALGVRRARDRIRLRPAVLAGLGWHLHRVWAAAWYRDREAALARVEAALAEAREGDPEEPTVEELAPVERDPGAVARPEAVDLPDFAPYDPWPGAIVGDFVDLPPADADAIVLAIARHEAPVSRASIARRISQRGGARRCDQKLTEAVVRVVTRLADGGALRKDGFFVTMRGAGRPTPRNRKGMYRWERASRQIPAGELEAALIDTLRRARVMPEDELIAAGARRLGLPRSEADPPASGPWESALGQLIADGRARRHDTEVIWEGA